MIIVNYRLELLRNGVMMEYSKMKMGGVIVAKLIDKVKKQKHSALSRDLTEGAIGRGLLAFAVPIFLGQMLQQFYNVADAWVVGNFGSNSAFAAVSSSGSFIFLIIGFFNGVSVGGGVVISHYFGARDKKNISRAIHANVLFGLLASVGATIAGFLMVPYILRWMQTPADVISDSMIYFRIYFAGVSTVIMFNICMSVMRALGDSLHPLFYLAFSSVLNVALDLAFVAVFQWGVMGAAAATVFSQGVSMVLCIVHMCREEEDIRLDFRKLTFDAKMMGDVLRQGLPAGIQNSVISIGNIVVQTNINSFGAYAMSGVGAYQKIEGFVFLPIMSMAMALPTFISQNLGAARPDRAKKGAAFGILFGMATAETVGLAFYLWCPMALKFFVDTEKAIAFGAVQARTVSLFFFLLAFSHCAAGVLRGCGKSFIPMAAMLTFWCGVRIIYVTTALNIRHDFRLLPWAYPLTWSCSAVVFLVFLVRSDWTGTGIRKKKNKKSA